MGNNEYDGREKRKHMRMIYPAGTRPVFRFRGQKLEIKDVSRSGLRFSCHSQIKVRGWVNGRMDLTDGTSIKVEGIVVRIDNNDMGLAFIGDLEDDVYRRITTLTRFANS